MRKLGVGIASFMLLSGVAVFAGAQNGVGNFCQQFAVETGVSQDACVVCSNEGASDTGTCFCKLVENGYLTDENGNTFTLDELGFKNNGQCVSYVNKNGPPPSFFE